MARPQLVLVGGTDVVAAVEQLPAAHPARDGDRLILDLIAEWERRDALAEAHCRTEQRAMDGGPAALGAWQAKQSALLHEEEALVRQLAGAKPRSINGLFVKARLTQSLRVALGREPAQGCEGYDDILLRGVFRDIEQLVEV